MYSIIVLRLIKHSVKFKNCGQNETTILYTGQPQLITVMELLLDLFLDKILKTEIKIEITGKIQLICMSMWLEPKILHRTDCV